MNREEKIAAIYKEMANKEKSFGCKYIAKHSKEGSEPFETRDVEDHFLSFKDGDHCYVDYLCDDSIRYDLIKVIGHPVMIGDVMHYIRKKYWNNHSWFHSDRSKLVDLWSKERGPIEGQCDECIDFVYSLIPKRVLDSISKK